MALVNMQSDWRLINYYVVSATGTLTGVLELDGMSTVGVHPLDHAVHPQVGRSPRGVCTVTTAVKVIVGTKVETALFEVFGKHVVDTRVLDPVGGTNPQVGNVAYLGEHLLQEGFTRTLNVGDIQLVGTQAHKDVIRVILVDELSQTAGLSPALGGTAIPDDLDQFVTVLVAIGSQTRCQSLKYRVADEEDILGSGVHGGLQRGFLAGRLTTGLIGFGSFLGLGLSLGFGRFGQPAGTDAKRERAVVAADLYARRRVVRAVRAYRDSCPGSRKRHRYMFQLRYLRFQYRPFLLEVCSRGNLVRVRCRTDLLVYA